MIKPIEKHVTIRDVAKAAGVSKSTVSKALNDKPDISPALRRKVFETCEALDYQVNYRIQDMVRERKNGFTRNIAFVLVGRELADPAYARFIDGIAKGADERNLHILLEKLSGTENAIYDLPPVLRDGRVDGIVITGDLNENIVSILNKLNKPYVVLGMFQDKITRNAVNILPDVKSGITQVVEELKKEGATRVAWFTETPENSTQRYHLECFKSALAENDLTFDSELVYKGDGLFSGAFNIMKPVFELKTLPFDSIICLDFRTALEITHLIWARYGIDGHSEITIAVSRPFDYYSLPVPAIYINACSDETAYQGIKALDDIFTKKESYTPKKIIVKPQITKGGPLC